MEFGDITVQQTESVLKSLVLAKDGLQALNTRKNLRDASIGVQKLVEDLRVLRS
jgi:hypothetical protein